jgi:hypothetical protein
MMFFGLTPKHKSSPQPRWRGVVDIDEAHREVSDVLAVWREVARWPDAAPFAGGVWDDWPRRLAQGIAFLRGESAAVVAYLTSLEESRG